MSDAFRGARVLITGGLGFIGSNLARRLVEAGADVTLVDTLIPEYGGNLDNIEGIEDTVRINISDVRDAHSLEYLVQGQDFLFNLAGQTSHLDSMDGPEHRPGDQRRGTAVDPRGLPAAQPGVKRRLRQHAAALRAAASTCRWTRSIPFSRWT